MIEVIVENPITEVFYSIRNYKPHRARIRFSRSCLSDRDIFLQKKLSRLNRKQVISKSEAAKYIINWICSIQKKLNLSHQEFVRKINKNGGQVTLLTVRLWRNSHGHFPNEKNFKALLLLDREANISKEDLKVIFGITTTRILEKNNV